MHDLAIGFFHDFRGADTVLLACSTAGVAKLRGLLASPPAVPLALHSFAEVAKNHPAALFASADAANPGRFTWLAGSDALPNVHVALNSLALAQHGHQYFDLVGVETKLLVALNEYDSSWWSTNA
jgi:hypothetical protein